SGVDSDDDDTLLEEHFLAGFGEVATRGDADIILSGSDVNNFLLGGFLAEINKAKLTLINEQKNPTVLSEVVSVSHELEIIQDVMSVWEDELERSEGLQDAIGASKAYSNFYQAILLAIDKMEEDEQAVSGFHDDDEIFLARMNMSEFLADDEDDLETSDLGRSRRKKRRLRNFFKKVGKGLKKAAKAVVRFNPATLALRGATLVVLKTNMFEIASKLIFGYLSEEQARAQGLDIGEWRKLVIAKNKAEKFYTNVGGKADKFRKAILTGRARKKTGLNLSGLGVVTAGAAAAGSGFIVFVKKLLSKVNPARLFKNFKAKRAAKKSARIGQDEASDIGADIGEEAFSTARRLTTGTEDFETVDDTPTGGDGAAPTMFSKAKVWAMNIWTKHKKKIMIGGVFGVFALIGLMVFNKMKKKRARSLAGIKGAETRARNRKKLECKPAKCLGKGSTTILKLPTSSIKKARVRTRSNSARLKKMHAIAKTLQKKHPKTKYSNLLSKAAKQMK
ncbi:MAG: hypothetical protein JKY52_06480, partial [Flavobacteriales bacterium]|nr:hypothetical protein [Flavobacteriales bacterium]